MSKSVDRISHLTAVWGLSLALVLSAVSALRAEEPKCQCQQETVVRETAVPMFSRLPFVKQLFTVAPPVCNGTGCGQEVDHLILAPGLPAEEAKRLGIVLDGTSGPHARGMVIVKRFEIQPCAGEECAASCTGTVAKQCTGESCAAETKVAASTKCCGENCTCESAKSTATGVAHAKTSCPCKAAAFESLLRLTEKAAEIAAEKAALEAALDAQEDVAVLMMENARLEAKLEFQEKREELDKEARALAAENAHLKAQVELANHRTEVTKQTLQLAIENERLKLRVAELERQSADSAAARTARRD